MSGKPLLLLFILFFQSPHELDVIGNSWVFRRMFSNAAVILYSHIQVVSASLREVSKRGAPGPTRRSCRRPGPRWPRSS